MYSDKLTKDFKENNVSDVTPPSETDKFPELKAGQVLHTHTQRLFNISNVINHSEVQNDLLHKKRKQYIKNGKFVFVPPDSAAAKKFEKEKVE
jgi:hypothetical protein